MFQQYDFEAEKSFSGYTGSMSVGNPELLYADSFEVPESFDLSSITFYGFQDVEFQDNVGAEIYIYKDKNGMPIGKPSEANTDFVMHVTLEDNSMAILKHLINHNGLDIEFGDYTIDIKRALELEGKTAQVRLEKNMKYWVVFALVTYGDS